MRTCQMIRRVAEMIETTIAIEVLFIWLGHSYALDRKTRTDRNRAAFGAEGRVMIHLELLHRAVESPDSASNMRIKIENDSFPKTPSHLVAVKNAKDFRRQASRQLYFDTWANEFKWRRMKRNRADPTAQYLCLRSVEKQVVTKCWEQERSQVRLYPPHAVCGSTLPWLPTDDRMWFRGF